MNDEQILDEFERRAMKLRDFMGYPTTDGVRVIEGVRALLAASASAEPVGEVGEPFGNQINWLGKVPKPGTKLYARPIEAPEHKK